MAQSESNIEFTNERYSVKNAMQAFNTDLDIFKYESGKLGFEIGSVSGPVGKVTEEDLESPEDLQIVVCKGEDGPFTMLCKRGYKRELVKSYSSK